MSRGRLLLLAAQFGLALGCGRIAGLDEYEVGEPRVDNPCGDLEVRENGECEPVGVLPSSGDVDGSLTCGRFLQSDLNGGCKPTLPDGACPDGELAYPGTTVCKKQDCFSPPPAVDRKARVFAVDWTAKTHGNGDAGSPFQSIAQALADPALQGEPPTLVLAAGVLPENVVLDRKVLINGQCRSLTTIRGIGDGPAILIGKGADGSQLWELGVTGNHDGILVDSARNVSLGNLHVHDVDGVGITFQDDTARRDQGAAAQPGVALGDAIGASGTVDGVLVERARESAVAVYGASVAITKTLLRDTRPRADGGLGRGISVHPSTLVRDAKDHVARADVTIEQTLIERVADAGIFVEGSHATIRGTVVRDLLPDALQVGATAADDAAGQRAHGRGIEVEPRYLGAVPADVTIEQVVIAGARDVGLSLHDARATVKSTTIRDVGSEDACSPSSGVESGLGNGVRVRRSVAFDGEPGGLDLSIEYSLVENTREAGIHVLGASALIDHVLVRGTGKDACADKGGDGVAAYSHPSLPKANVEVVATRIEGSARAAAASFDAVLEARDIVSACNAADVVERRSAGEPSTSASGLCGCDHWRHCASAPSERATSVFFGEPPCVPGENAVCLSGCWGQYKEDRDQQGGKLKDVVTWDLDREDARLTRNDEEGCNVEGSAPRAARYRSFNVHVGERLDEEPGRRFMPTLVHWTSGAGSASGWFRGSMGELDLLGVAGFEGGGIADLRTSPLVYFEVCLPSQDPPPTDGKTEPCIGNGVEGARVEIADLPRYHADVPPYHAVNAPDGSPRVYIDDGDPTDLSNVAITRIGGVAFFGVPAGRHTVRVLPPDDGRQIDCTLDAFGDGWGIGWQAAAKNEFEFIAEPGRLVHGGRVFCVDQRAF